MIIKNNNTFQPKVGASIEYLHSLGIQEVDSFLYKPKPSDYESPWLLDNMKELITAIHKGFENNKKFFIQVDSDTDGITSSAIFYNYFTTLYPQAYIKYRVHEGKQHGVILDTIPVETDIIIIPDAGSNQLDEQEVLSNNGRTVLIMDHHNVENHYDYPNVIIVNNQTSENFKNKDLSGAGVVYKVIQAYDEVFGKRILYKRYEDLASLGIVADMMDTRNLDNNAIIRNGLNAINNNMFKALINKQSNPFQIKHPEKLNKTDVAFYIAPLINAVIRSGTIEEKTAFFEGFINSCDKNVVTTIYRGQTREENIYDYLARTACNLRNRQNTAKEKSLILLQNKIDADKLDDNKVLIITTDNINISQNITGLAAMDICKLYNKPTLILRPVSEDGKEYYRGSGRAIKTDGFYDFQHLLLESGLMDYCQGHNMAFGVSIEKKNISALTTWLNERMANIVFSSDNEVDCAMDETNWTPLVLKEFAEMVDVFGAGIPQPKFYFTFDARIDDFNIQGKNNDSLKFMYKGVTFVTFRNKKLIEDYNKLCSLCMKNNTKIKIELIGCPEINEWLGYRNIQVMIKSIELTESKKKSNILF